MDENDIAPPNPDEKAEPTEARGAETSGTSAPSELPGLAGDGGITDTRILELASPRWQLGKLDLACKSLESILDDPKDLTPAAVQKYVSILEQTRELAKEIRKELRGPLFIIVRRPKFQDLIRRLYARQAQRPKLMIEGIQERRIVFLLAVQ